MRKHSIWRKQKRQQGEILPLSIQALDDLTDQANTTFLSQKVGTLVWVWNDYSIAKEPSDHAWRLYHDTSYLGGDTNFNRLRYFLVCKAFGKPEPVTPQKPKKKAQS